MQKMLESSQLQKILKQIQQMYQLLKQISSKRKCVLETQTRIVKIEQN